MQAPLLLPLQDPPPARSHPQPPHAPHLLPPAARSALPACSRASRSSNSLIPSTPTLLSSARLLAGATASFAAWATAWWKLQESSVSSWRDWPEMPGPSACEIGQGGDRYSKRTQRKQHTQTHLPTHPPSHVHTLDVHTSSIGLRRGVDKSASPFAAPENQPLPSREGEEAAGEPSSSSSPSSALSPTLAAGIQGAAAAVPLGLTPGEALADAWPCGAWGPLAAWSACC